MSFKQTELMMYVGKNIIRLGLEIQRPILSAGFLRKYMWEAPPECYQVYLTPVFIYKLELISLVSKHNGLENKINLRMVKIQTATPKWGIFMKTSFWKT